MLRIISFPHVYCACFNVNENSLRVFAASTHHERSPRVALRPISLT